MASGGESTIYLQLQKQYIFLVGFLSTVALGMMMKVVIDPNWSNADALFFGALLFAIYPIEALDNVKEPSVQSKYIKILLEGETILTTSWIINLDRVLFGYMNGYIIWWYQFAMYVVRILGLGVPLSYIIGLIGCCLMKLAYHDSAGLMTITISICYGNFFLSKWISSSGTIPTVIVGLIMGVERTSLPLEVEKTISGLWKVIVTILNGILFVYAGTIIPLFLWDNIKAKDFVLIPVTYLIANISRFVCFFLFSPLLSRLGYGMSLQSMLICVWGGLKNPICLILASKLSEIYVYDKRKAAIFCLHIYLGYMLVLIINGSCMNLLIRALGLLDLSLSRQINMNNCLKYIYDARAKTVSILKMDRHLSDVNWPLVMQATTLKHPYKKKSGRNRKESIDITELEDDFLGYKFTLCPECKTNVANQPTPRELKEMTKEAKMRILKLKKSIFWRLYENGMISRHGIKIMQQAVEVAMDSENLVIELDGLFKLFTKEKIFYKFLKDRVQQTINNKTIPKPPRRQWRQLCYRFVNNEIFAFILNNLFILNIFLMFWHILFPKKKILWFTDYGVECFFLILYVIVMLLKIFALSWIYICQHGVKNYFKCPWNILEFIIIIIEVVSVILHGVTLKEDEVCFYIDIILIVFLGIRSFRIFVYLKYCAMFESIMSTFIDYLETKVDKQKALAFELGKNYIAAEEEIIENLNQIVDNLKIREDIKQQKEKNKLAVSRRLGIAQKESPKVAVTVKTQLTIRTVLNNMRGDINNLKVSGWVDNLENTKLLKSLNERYKYVGLKKTIPQQPAKLMFREIPFMGDEDEIIDYLYSNVITKKFEADEFVYKEGDIANALYIIISGMLKVVYTPNQTVLANLNEYGALPIADYICSITYEEPICEYLIPGNTVGHLSILTGRAYNGNVTSETQTIVYVLHRNVLEKAFAMSADPVNGLECRLWKYFSFRRALMVLKNTTSYRSYTKENIQFSLERAFVPNLSNYKVFMINDMMTDIVLIEGVAVDFNNREIYTGPCYIQRAVQKLIFPKHSFLNMQTPVETKLMIIPSKDYNEYEIMMNEEQICELVAVRSSRCLQHFIRDKNLNVLKSRSGDHSMKQLSSHRRLRSSFLKSQSSSIGTAKET